MNATENLATFDDKDTMRYERTYPHPIERVWEAVTTTEHLEAWLLPASQVERRLGGRCAFSWGSPVGEAVEDTVTIFDPPLVVRYGSGETGFIEFDLEELDANTTRLTFIHHIAPGQGLEPSDWPGGDQPGGPDSPWKPGFVAGFHGFLDQLGLYLDGEWTRERAQPAIDEVYNGKHISDAWEKDPTSRSPANQEASHGHLIEVYREHIRVNQPR